MTQAIRHAEILDLARRDGGVSVDTLAQHFNVSVQTVRKDLTDLAESGRLMRVHGGAVLPSGTRNIAHEERAALNAQAKEAMARACAAQIPNGASLFLTIGTSAEAVARELLHHDGLMVVTNNLIAAEILQANERADIVLSGGQVRRADRGLVGDLARQTMTHFQLDFAIMGCSALSATGDVLDFDLGEVAVNQAVIAAARQTCLLADASKFHRTAPVRVATLRDMTAFFTDAPVSNDIAELCDASGTEIHVAPA